jgi:hypothetical protein
MESGAPSRELNRTKAPWSMRGLLLVMALAMASFVYFFGVLRFQYAVHADENCYYAYLPAYIVEHDPTFRSWQSHGDVNTAGEIVLHQNTGAYLDECGIGEAVILAPAFMVSHSIASATGGPSDGYSAFEELGTHVTSLLVLALGLILLRRILLRHFTDVVAGITLVLLAAGSNLLNYATADGLFTHIYTFTLCAALIEVSYRWWSDGRWRWGMTVAAILGLMVLVRNISVIFALVPLLYGVTGWQSARLRAGQIWSRRGQIVAMAGVFMALMVPQMIVWHIATNSWIVYSYGHEHFDFAHPQLFGALFSFQPHGLFPWSPVIFLAVVGLVTAHRTLKDSLFMVVVTCSVFTYLIASWDSWWFGGGFGQRGFVDIYPLLAPGLAGFLQSVARRPAAARWVSGIVLAVICYAVLVETNHYWHLGADSADPLGWGGATPAQYLDGVLHPGK